MGRKSDHKLETHSKKRYRNIAIFVCVLLPVLLMIAVPTYFHYNPKKVDYPCELLKSTPLLNPDIFRNGSIADSGIMYSPEQYFILNDILRGCVCELKPCIRKCCGEGEYYVRIPKKLATCEPDPPYNPFENFTIPVYNSSWHEVTVSQDHFWTLHGNPCPNGKYVLGPEERNLLMIDGIISTDDETVPVSRYCLESMNGSKMIRTFICSAPEESAEERAMFTLYSSSMLITIPFMVATVVVYGVVAELRNLHGKCLISHSASLCVTYICLSIVQISRDEVPTNLCIFIAFTVQYTFLASFFWMNVMCFDIWWVFSGFRAQRGSAKEEENKKFLMYSVYAWGVPSFILAVSLVMDFAPFIPDTFIKPGFGYDKCWFKDHSGTILYFYLPIAVVVLLNIVMFISTAFRLRAHTKETKVLHGSESRQSTKADKDRFNLYLKLFVVMGINWVMELVSFVVGGPKSLWFVTDIGNTLQGLLIFLIFVCKRRVMRLVSQKLCPGRIFSTDSKNGPSQSQSSQTTSTLVSKTSSTSNRE